MAARVASTGCAANAGCTPPASCAAFQMRSKIARRGSLRFSPEATISSISSRVDALREEIEEIVASGEKRKLPRRAIFERIWKAAHEAGGVQPAFAAQPVLATRAAIP